MVRRIATPEPLFLSGLIQELTREGYAVMALPPAIRLQISAAFKAGLRFFRTSHGEKMANQFKGDLGFRPTGIEYSQVPQRPDQIESFSVFADRRLKPRGTVPGRLLFGRLIKVFRTFEPIAEELTISLAGTFGEASNGEKIRGAIHRWSCVQINYSRPANVKMEFINDAHEDGHFLTFACATGPGLEVQTKDGEFKPIAYSPEQIIIMPGEIAFLLSGGSVLPLYHRVRPKCELSERMALLMFIDIDPVFCLPWVTNEFNATIDIGRRVRTNPARFGLDRSTSS